MNIIGYAVFAHSKKLDCLNEPLAYGCGREPTPEMLLRRSRIELFDTSDAAAEALKASLVIAKRENIESFAKFKFSICPVVKQ